IVLCPTCHTSVDQDVDYYSIEKLKEIKRNHEERIKFVTEIPQDNFVLAVTYHTMIHDKQNFFNSVQINDAILKDYYYPLKSDPIDLSIKSEIPDNSTDY